MLCLKYLEPSFSKDLLYIATVSKDSFHGFQQHLKVITLSANETLRYQNRYPENEENTVKNTTNEIPALYDFQCLFLHFPSVMPFFIMHLFQILHVSQILWVLSHRKGSFIPKKLHTTRKLKIEYKISLMLSYMTFFSCKSVM